MVFIRDNDNLDKKLFQSSSYPSSSGKRYAKIPKPAAPIIRNNNKSILNS
jgi:hypothetical protein